MSKLDNWYLLCA